MVNVLEMALVKSIYKTQVHKYSKGKKIGGRRFLFSNMNLSNDKRVKFFMGHILPWR
jgi:hypothetical protein